MMGEENRKGAPEESGAFQKVLGSLNQGQKIRALEIARKHGIPDDDPVWHVVLTIAEAEEGFKEVARSLREASVSVTEATAAVVKAGREKAALEITNLREESVIEINETKEKAKGDLAKALGGTLKDEIEKAVNQLKSHSNRPLHKKWLIAMGVVVLVALGLGGWGTYTVHQKWDMGGWSRGFDDGWKEAIPTVESFHQIFDCKIPGYKVTWSADGKKAFCVPGPDPKTGQITGVRIR